MPSIDEFHLKRSHIRDRNRANSSKTVCGQLIGPTTFYYEKDENLTRANCGTCRKLFFGEDQD